jgi:DNA-binding LacI/PurR family transcriptional regulator
MQQLTAEPTMATSTARRTRLSDVAELAGVAASTASAALNGGHRVSSSTRARVLQAATELKYEGPDPWARALRTKHTRTICVIADPTLIEQSPQQVLRLLESISALISGAGGFVVWIAAGTDRASQIAAVPAEGAVIIGASADGERLALASRGVRYVNLDQDADDSEVESRLAELHSHEGCEHRSPVATYTKDLMAATPTLASAKG